MFDAPLDSRLGLYQAERLLATLRDARRALLATQGDSALVARLERAAHDLELTLEY